MKGAKEVLCKKTASIVRRQKYTEGSLYGVGTIVHFHAIDFS